MEVILSEEKNLNLNLILILGVIYLEVSLSFGCDLNPDLAYFMHCPNQLS